MSILKKHLQNLPTSSVVFTIGMFDGVHRGHKKLLQEMTLYAAQKKIESCVLTFSSHPKTLVHEKNQHLLITSSHKEKLLKEEGISHILTVPFSHEVRTMLPDQFLEEINHLLDIQTYVFTKNCLFGKDKQGTLTTLQGYSERKSQELFIVEPLQEGSSLISSTRIRDALLARDIDEVSSLLGRPYSLLLPIEQQEENLIVNMQDLFLPYGVWDIEETSSRIPGTLHHTEKRATVQFNKPFAPSQGLVDVFIRKAMSVL